MKQEQIQIGLGAELRMRFGWIRDEKGFQSRVAYVWISVKRSDDTGVNQGDQVMFGSGNDPRMDHVGIDTESRMD